MEKEIIIIPGCTDLNRGDQALVWESANLVADLDPKARFCVLESGTKKEDIHLQSRQTKALGFEIIPKVLRHPSRITQNSAKQSVGYSKTNYILWGMQGVYDLLATSLVLSRWVLLNKIGEAFLGKEQKATVERFRKADAVIVKGGGFIHAYGRVTDFYTMYFSLYHVLLALRFRRKVMIFPNSIGPVKGYFTRKLVKRVLTGCKLVTVRERVSENYLRDSFGLQPGLFPDLGFYLKPKQQDYRNYLLSKGVPLGKKKLVGVTLRPYRFPNSPDPEVRYRNYVDEIVNFVKLATNEDFHIVFFAHTLGPSSHEDDRLAIKDVLAKLPSELNGRYSYLEDFDLDCKDIMGLYSHLDFMVGTRFHSVIFALNVNVPCLAIAYGGNKSFGIMADMKLSEFVYPIEGFKGSRFYELLLSAVNDKQTYLEKIAAYRVYLDNARIELQREIAPFIN